ncbi:Hypothetical predicted protein [Mytilus galloprovincialis]|uniref:KY-like immunoglobulin-like domain-containing protein n=1 Tax=Mytilus galloprovincialis TaxID=29158 RepID=A0A8B6C160_MYTGA|nr:Hypothetical predicted protein [Mytilus galloprovincialis]
MGCGKSQLAEANADEELPQEGHWDLEQGLDTLNIPMNLPHYPSPHVGAEFDLSEYDFNVVDSHALMAPAGLAISYEKLCKYLVKPEFDEIEIVRSFVVWISCQKIRTRLYPGSPSPQTPLGYMKMIKNKTGTFAALLTQMCRQVNIPCVIVRGIYKSSHFAPSRIDPVDFQCTWCTVCLDGDWGFVHPFLICTPSPRRVENAWTSIEDGGNFIPGPRPWSEDWNTVDPLRVAFLPNTNKFKPRKKTKIGNKRIVKSATPAPSRALKRRKVRAEGNPDLVLDTGMYTKLLKIDDEADEETEPQDIIFVRRTKRVFNETFFLIEPREIILHCFPDLREWQLLQKPVEIKRFLEYPHISVAYHEIGFCNPADQITKYISRDGILTFKLKNKIKANQHTMKLGYELTQLGGRKTPSFEGSFVLLYQDYDIWTVHLRCPTKGFFRLVIFATAKTNDYSKWIVDTEIECLEVRRYCTSIPIHPGSTGWGPQALSESLGLYLPSHEVGVIPMYQKEDYVVKFILLRHIDMKCELTHSDFDKKDVAKQLSYSLTNRELDFKVSALNEGDYVLSIYVFNNQFNEYVNAVNYLFTDKDLKSSIGKLQREPVPIKKAKYRLKAACIGDNVEELEDAIQSVLKEMPTEDEDVRRGKKRLAFIRLRRDLRDGINRRHIKTLGRAVVAAKKSRFARLLKPNTDAAEDLKAHLETLEMFSHDVLELKQWTISEIENYAHPPKGVVNTMQATYILLGETPKYLKEWGNIQHLLRKQHDNSIIIRIKNYTGSITPDIIQLAVRKLRGVDVMEVKHASAGAATFYQWARNVLDEMEEGTFSPRKMSQNFDSLLTARDRYMLNGRTYYK